MDDNNRLLVAPTGYIDDDTRAELRASGVIVVEVPDPSAVRLLIPSSSLIQGDAILMSALHALDRACSYNADAEFRAELYRRACETERTAKLTEKKPS